MLCKGFSGHRCIIFFFSLFAFLIRVNSVKTGLSLYISFAFLSSQNQRH